MTDEERQKRNNHPKIRELKNKICTKDSEKYYLFVSYKSDEWEIVLTEIVYKLVNKYGLNVYYDGSFDLHNDSWVKQMPMNMNAYNCVGILAFLSKKYSASYATLMELMHSQTNAASAAGLPIIPVNLEDLYEINGKEGDKDTGLGMSSFTDGTTNPNAKSERDLFDKDYENVINRSFIKSEFKCIYRKDESLTKRYCSTMIRELLASKGYNTNMYDNTDGFYENLVNTIKNTCNDSEVNVFSVPTPPNPVPTPTGDITYTIYGRKYTDNQANMMLNVFAKVLKKHPEAVGRILANPEKPLIRCTSAINYRLPENKTKEKPSQYNSGCFFEIGRGIFVGTAINYKEKLRSISQLLSLCCEDFSVLQSDQITLPGVKPKPTTSGEERYCINGEERTGNQTDMMCDILKFLVEKHFDQKDELAGLLSIKIAPLSELSNVSYFNSGKEYSYQGVTYSIGTSFGKNNKLNQIKKAADICGEDVDQFENDDLSSIAPLTRKRTTKKRDFLND